jgi:predicted metalloprotease with PDZ domain
VQTLEEASLDVWNTPTSGLPRDTDTNTISYYIKGPIVAFLLDARIQSATGGRKSLDDVLRLVYKRYSGLQGFTTAGFRKSAEDVAGAGLGDWLRHAVSSTQELDYREALNWFRLQFATPEQKSKPWQLAVRADATTAQKRHWRKLTTGR